MLLYYNASYYYPYRGGGSDNGDLDGSFFVLIGYIEDTTYWNRGAALSLVHIMLFVVAILEIMITVVHSIFMLTVMLLILIWALALLYHLNFISIYNYIL